MKAFGVHPGRLATFVGLVIFLAGCGSASPTPVDGGGMSGADPTGQKLVFIAAQPNAFNQFAVYAKPEVKTIKDLKGRTIGAASPGSAATVAFETILKLSGMDSKNDVKWAYLGTPAAQWTALSNGNIEASINAFPY